MAGSRAGKPNKATKAREQIIAKQGVTPLGYLLEVLRDETEDRPVRIDAAKAAAPYVHPRLSNIDVNAQATVEMNVTGIERRIVSPPDRDG